MNNQVWSKEDDEELNRMRNNGSSWETVSEELDRPIPDCKERHANIAEVSDERGSRTSEALRGTLFEAMDRLMSGSMDHQEAKAVCGLSQSICDTVRLEMEARRLQESLHGAKPNRHLKLSER